ncbi:MAG: DUF2911 domain-containing protein [Saprospiraceae bacterium]|nr:DUF2911 domain-containing protein [Saprospiraceae bacterium]
MKRTILLFLSVALMFTALNAQIRTPQASPTAKLEQSVGLSTITVEYSRPSAKGRKIFGDLVPTGKYWRTGANAGTKLTFSDDVKISGKEVKKGKYAFFTIPGEMEWTLILYKNADLNVPGGDDYKMTDETLRFTAKPTKTSNPVETFTIDFENIKDGGADLFLKWENTKVAFNIDVNTDAKVVASITSVMAGPSGGDYMAAANYYMNSGKDMNKAVEWAAKGVSLGANQFWNLRAYSLILAKAGKTSEAITAAKESLVKAKEAKNDDYIKMNEKSIADWTAMKK